MHEPLGRLDAQTRLVTLELLLSVWERHHQAVLFITHDIEEALLIADSVSVMTARPGRPWRSLLSAPVDGSRSPPRGAGLTCPGRSDRIGARCPGASAR